MANNFDEILSYTKDDNVPSEVKKVLLKLQLENVDLKKKNSRLQIENSNSRANQFKKSNENLREKNKELKNMIKNLEKQIKNYEKGLDKVLNNIQDDDAKKQLLELKINSRG